MLQRIRLAMQSEDPPMIDGEAEVHETFIGGKARFMHRDAKERKIKGTGGIASRKGAAMGLLDRHGPDGHSTVRAKVVPNIRRSTLATAVRANVKPGATVYTDALGSYNDLDEDFVHGVIDHAERYADGQVTTNGIENFWSLLKRAIKETCVSVEPFHLFRYLDEEVFRFNTRQRDDAERFVRVLTPVEGRRLTYRELTGNIGSG